MLCAVGSQTREKDYGAFLKFSKTKTFSRKKYPHKTKDIYLVMHFSPDTTKKTKVKKFLLKASRYFSGKQQNWTNFIRISIQRHWYERNSAYFLTRVATMHEIIYL